MRNPFKKKITAEDVIDFIHECNGVLFLDLGRGDKWYQLVRDVKGSANIPSRIQVSRMKRLDKAIDLYERLEDMLK